MLGYKAKKTNTWYSVTVNVEGVGEKFNVYVSYPKSQPRMPLRQSCHALVAGINVIIRGCAQNDLGIKDHELLDEVIEHLRSEFIGVESLEDVMVDESVVEISKKESKE